MQILFVTDQYKPAVNGIVNYINLVKGELEKRGHTVWIVAPNFGKKTEPEDRVFRLPSVVFPPRPIDRFCFPYNPRVEKELANISFDIVHNHLFMMGFLGERVAKKQHIPMVTSLHTPFSQFLRWTYPSLLPYSMGVLNFLMRWYFKKSDMALGPSRRATDELKDAGVSIPIQVLHNGIDFAPFKKATDKIFFDTYGVKRGTPIITLIGRVDPGKNVHLGILAMKYVLKKIPNAQLIVCGEGVLEEKMRKLAEEEQVKDHVTFIGFVAKNVITSINKAATVSLMTSDTDTLPTVTTEAMACGKAVVAVNDKATVDLVGDNVNGFLLPKDPEKIGEALVTVLSDEKLRKKFEKNSLKRVKEFSIQLHVSRLLKIYEDLMNFSSVHAGAS